MKTSILQLEPHDDVISARDKMGWSKSARILLVWPRRGRILRRRMDLLLLQRRGQELGAQIALVTRDRQVQLYARELGIPVFSGARQAQSQSWHTRSRLRVTRPTGRVPADPVELRRQYTEFHRLPGGFLQHPLPRFLIFLTGVLSAVILVLFFYPSARVEISPVAREQAVTLSLRASPSISAVNASGGLPAERTSVVVEGQADLPATGQVREPDAFAQGAVVFTNLTAGEVNIPAGTVVRTLSKPPVRFETTAPAVVPPGPGESVEARVRAVLPGLEGNVAAGKITAVEGNAGLSVSAANPNALEGGSERAVRAPSAHDEARLREKLLAELRQNALLDLNRMVMAEKEVLPASVAVGKVLFEDRQPPEGQPADRLRMNMRVEFTALTVRTFDVRVIAQAALGANLPAGFQPVPENLQIERLQEPVMEDGQDQAHWQIRAVEQIRAAWTPDEVAGLAVGRTPAEAGAVIAQRISLNAPPRITLRPYWWVRMPFIAFRIEVVTQ